MNTWKTDPNQLAWKMLAYIEKENRDVTYDELEKRAITHDIDLSLLDTALATLHKHAKVKQRVKGGDIVYCPAVEKARDPNKHLTWVRNNYPPMTRENDGSGIEADYSYLFLSPEEMEKFKCEQKGKPYIPRKKKKTTVKKKPELTAAQQMMLQFNQ